MPSRMLYLVHITVGAALFVALATTTSCPVSCRCTNHDANIQCVDQVLFHIPRLPDSTVRLNLSNIFLGPNLASSMGYLHRLSHLTLSSNMIVRISNSTFRGLHNLTHLDLSNNRLKTLQDDLLLDNPNIQVLDLSGNGLSSLHEAFYKYLPRLRELYLSRNNFFQLKLGLRYQVLAQLEILDLSYNDFGDVTNDAFENIHRWNNNIQRSLKLAHCKISSVENGTFIPFRGLYDLDLSGVTTLSTDNITVIMKDLQHTNAKRLDMSSMGLTNIDTIFTSSPQLALEFLNLSHNHIENISSNAFSHLGSLQYLDISSNNMKLLQPSFNTLGNLKVLDISHNKYKAFSGPAVSHLAKLETLKATHNLFDDRSLLQLTSLQQLKVLDLSYNTLDDLVTTGNNAKLEKLILAGNNITRLDMIPEAKNLKFLDVSGNKMTALGPYTFSSAVNIDTVDLSGNQISVIDQLAFLPNSSIAYNINLSSNRLSRVNFGGWGRARVLNLSHNQISQVDFHAFLGMNNLQSLDLSHNEILGVDDETFKYLMNLESLNLAHNRLESHVNVKRIKNTFSTLVSLKTINLSYNNITHLDANVFEDNKNLVKMSLAKNKFSSFIPEMFNSLNKLQHLDISANPFRCNCELLPLVSWLQETDPLIYGKYTHKYKCVGPADRVGKSIFDFQVNFLECDEDLLELIVFGSLGGLTIIVGIIGTVVCRLYQKWSEGAGAQTEKEKKTKTYKVRKAKGTCTVEELPLEILNELDHYTKMKLLAAKQNGLSPMVNGGPAYIKTHHGANSKLETAKKEIGKSNKKVKDTQESSRSRSRSKSSDKKRSKSRSKSRDRSHSKDHEKRDKRDRDRIRRFEKELRYTLARYNPTSRWDAEGRDRWATMGGEWVSKREYNPVKADRFYTMPSYRHPHQTLLDDRELERSEYSRVYRPRVSPPAARTSRSRQYSCDDMYRRRLSPVYRYDVVRAPRRSELDERKESTRHHWTSYPGLYSTDSHAQYGRVRPKTESSWPEAQYGRERPKTESSWPEALNEPRSRGDKLAQVDMKCEKTVDIKPAPSGRQERQYVELPFPDTKDQRARRYKPDVTFQTHRSRSYGSIDFKAKKRRFEDECPTSPTLDTERDFHHESNRYDRNNPVFQNGNHKMSSNTDSRNTSSNQVQVDVHVEKACRTPDPDYPTDNPKSSDWV